MLAIRYFKHKKAWPDVYRGKWPVTDRQNESVKDNCSLLYFLLSGGLATRRRSISKLLPEIQNNYSLFIKTLTYSLIN